MTHYEEVWWLYGIETASNDAGESGDWEAQEFFCDWFADFREGFLANKTIRA